jgi:hypothetical protein
MYEGILVNYAPFPTAGEIDLALGYSPGYPKQGEQ